MVMLEDEVLEIRVEGCSVLTKLVKPESGYSPDAPTLVFLHEGLGSIGQWRDFPQALVRETGLAALIFDRYGFGGSDPLHQERDGSYLQREDISSLSGVLDFCGIKSPILIGHSDGGTIALLFAACFAERTVGVIVEATHVFTESLTLSGIRDAVVAYSDRGLREKLVRYHGDKTDDMFFRWVDDWLSPEFRGWSIEAGLPSVRCPVLVIQGEDDEYGTIAQVESIRSRVSGRVESLLIPGCGHSPHHQAREAVLQEMKRFIAEMVSGNQDESGSEGWYSGRVKPCG